MSKKAKTQAERDHHERIASMSCVVCDALDLVQIHRTEVHHLREGQGASQRAPHYIVVPLCKACHTGPMGVHGDQTYMRMAKMDELDMLNETIKRLSAEGLL